MDSMYENTQWKALPNIQKKEFIDVFMRGYEDSNPSVLITRETEGEFNNSSIMNSIAFVERMKKLSESLSEDEALVYQSPEFIRGMSNRSINDNK